MGRTRHSRVTRNGLAFAAFCAAMTGLVGGKPTKAPRAVLTDEASESASETALVSSMPEAALAASGMGTSGTMFAPPPAGAVTNARWRLRGAWRDAFFIPASNWWARTPSGGWAAGVRVFAGGGFQTCAANGARDGYPAPCAASLAPEANGPRLVRAADGAGGLPAPASLFWHAATPSNTLLLTWQDALRGRSPADLVTVQTELRPDGSARTRLRADGAAVEESVFAPPLAFDRDGDGVVDGFAPAPAPTNAAAYYTVGVIAARGPAPIRFTADRPNDAGSPAVVNDGAATNFVPLLIGVSYAVSSDTPFSLSVPPDGHAVVTPGGETSCTVEWPLDFALFDDGDTCAVIPYPADPGGRYEWGGAAADARSPLASLLSLPLRAAWEEGPGINNCGCLEASGRVVRRTCRTPCVCAGGCGLSGRYVSEGAVFPLPDIGCRCNLDEEDAPDEPGEGTADGDATVGVSFSAPVVFYEDAYENAPGESVARRATQTVLTVSADGGADGALLYVTAENIGNLACVGGALPVFPHTRMLAPNEHVDLTAVCEPRRHSGAENDIRVRARIKPAGGGDVRTSSASATAVKVLLQAHTPAPFDGNSCRHRYGIGEAVSCTTVPTSPSIVWSFGTTGTSEYLGNGYYNFYCPLVRQNCTITVSYVTADGASGNGNLSYSPNIDIIEPTGLVCESVESMNSNFAENIAGGIGMRLSLYVTPKTVSFGKIALEEVPTTEGLVGGYFLNDEFQPMWAHTRERGAGHWQDIGNDNFFMDDCAMLGDELPPMSPDGTLTNDLSFAWRDGTIVWTIPLGWNEHGTSSESPYVRLIGQTYRQVFEIDDHGTVRVSKIDHSVERGTNSQVRLDGVLQ